MDKQVINGKLAVDKRQLVTLLGATMYKGDLSSVAMKELIQNSFDAIKIARPANPHIQLTLDSTKRTITVSDNGTGMTPDIVQSAFFTLGGSFKGENVSNGMKSGGFGFAKMQFLLSTSFFELTTVKDGIKSYALSTPEDVLNDNFEIVVEPTNLPNGTTVTVGIPEFVIDGDGNKKNIYFSYSCFPASNILWDGIRYTAVRNGYTMFDEILSSKPKGYISLGVATANFGKLEVFVCPADEYSIRTNVYISGLYQFRHDTSVSNKASVSCIINIIPTVGVKSPFYPINNQREGFRPTVDAEVEDLNYLLKRINVSAEKRAFKAMFNRTVSAHSCDVAAISRVAPSKTDILTDVVNSIRKEFIPDPTSDNTISLTFVHTKRTEEKRRSSLDTSGINLEDDDILVDTSKLSFDRPVFHNNTTVIIDKEGQLFLDKIGEKMLQLKSLFLQTYHDSKDFDIKKMCRAIERQYWGISLDKDYVGVNVDPSVISLLAINPFAKVYFGDYVSAIDAISAIEESITHIILHEFTHNLVSYEGESFTAMLRWTYALFAGIGLSFKQWRNDVRAIVRENKDLILHYMNTYNNDASNITDSLRSRNS